MPCICRVYTLEMLIRPKDYMNNGKPQIITKSDFKQCFQHMLSPEIFPKYYFPLSSTYILHPKRNLSTMSFIRRTNQTFILLLFLWYPNSDDAEWPKRRSDKRKPKGSGPETRCTLWKGESETQLESPATVLVEKIIAFPSGLHRGGTICFFPQWLAIPAKNDEL